MEKKYGILVNKFSGSMPRKTGNGEVFRRRSFFRGGRFVSRKRRPKGVRKFGLALGGGFFGFGPQFVRKRFMPGSYSAEN